MAGFSLHNTRKGDYIIHFFISRSFFGFLINDSAKSDLKTKLMLYLVPVAWIDLRCLVDRIYVDDFLPFRLDWKYGHSAGLLISDTGLLHFVYMTGVMMEKSAASNPVYDPFKTNWRFHTEKCRTGVNESRVPYPLHGETEIC